MDIEYYEAAILKRLQELNARMHDIDEELHNPKPKDLEEQAVDLEDDEVLEGLGIAAQREAMLLKKALSRIEDKTYGVCLSCEGAISEERLKAVLFAPLCRNCANGAGR